MKITKPVIYGKIKSLKYGKEKILKQVTDKYGYMRVCLRKNNKNYNKQVHILIAEIFIANPENKPQVNHKDTNKQNNKVSNLEWNTIIENQRHAWKNGLKENVRKHCIKLCDLNKKIVNQYDLRKNLIKTWGSATEAGKQLIIDQSSISKCCKGIRKTAGNYIWKYSEDT